MMMKQTALATLLMAALLPVSAAAQENPLAAARELYASARYDEALAVLNGLRPSDDGSPVERRSIEQYRSLCLLALGRGTEAEAAIAAVIAVDPMYVPGESEASPRVRAAFSEVRQRQLPEIARSRYALAKSTFDRKQYAAAEQQFRELLRLVDDPDMGGRLEDLRVLAVGFLDLSAAAVAPPPAPELKPESAPPPTSAPAPKKAPANQIFAADEPGIIPPTPLRQDVPRVPSQITNQTRDRGLLELVIDEQGRVASLNLRVALHPLFDPQLLAAARDWRYRPATLHGQPVKFRKMVQITVDRR
jgi:hypothetical protein